MGLPPFRGRENFSPVTENDKLELSRDGIKRGCCSIIRKLGLIVLFRDRFQVLLN
jgi:hypothetical protein